GHGVEDEVDEEEVARLFCGMLESLDWSPYPNKTCFLLDLFDNLARLRLSTAQLRFVLLLMKGCGARDVPSLYAFRRLQKKLASTVGIRTRHFKSSLGNIYSSNDIGQAIARDWANPELGPLLQIYPAETTGPRSELWHFDRLKELDRSLLTPMYLQGHKHFYVNEIARLRSGQFVIPLIWIIRDKELCADAYFVTVAGGNLTIDTTERSFAARDLRDSFLDLERRNPLLFESTVHVTGELPQYLRDSMAFNSLQQNPLRALAGGVPLYSSFLHQWSDDVSGNQTKQYNKHENICIAHANIPGRLLQQEYNVRFVSTSTHATSLEQFEAVDLMIKESHTSPISTLHVTADARYQCKIRLIPISCLADNPQQSIEASHIGPGGNLLCRSCKVGGPAVVTSTAEGYASLFHEGAPRSGQETLACIQEQIDAAKTGIESAVTSLQTATGVKDRLAQYWIDRLIIRARELKNGERALSDEDIVAELTAWLKAETGEHEAYNVLLTFAGLDPNVDTPVEILHTVLLGIVKYAWHGFHMGWTPDSPETFVARLQATDMHGLSSVPLRASYIVQYKNNLVGKHFKTLMQTLSFHAHGLTSDGHFHLFKCIGALGAALWVVEIDDLEQYLADLEVLIDNVLDAFVALDPSRIVNKQKIHVLKHLVRDIRRFGLAIRFSTEIFECFNAVFRFSSILSNHQAPSRDIAHKMASLERVKHIVSGGYWSTDNWKTVSVAGNGVRAYLHSHPVVMQHLGWTRAVPHKIGAVILPGRSKRKLCSWTETLAARYISDPPASADTSNWIHATRVTVHSGDTAETGSWVCVELMTSYFKATYFGRVSECVVSASDGNLVYVTVERFRLGDTRHAKLDMPILTRPPTQEFLVLEPHSVRFVFNTQHDCIASKCGIAVASTTVYQERQSIAQSLPVHTHKDNSAFVINTHALHNAHLLRRFLPRHLVAPTRVHTIGPARDEFHAKLAARLRQTLAASNEKKQKKREEKKKAAQMKAGSAAGAGASGTPTHPQLPTTASNGGTRPTHTAGRSRRAPQAHVPAPSQPAALPQPAPQAYAHQQPPALPPYYLPAPHLTNAQQQIQSYPFYAHAAPAAAGWMHGQYFAHPGAVYPGAPVPPFQGSLPSTQGTGSEPGSAPDQHG
ncbi:hypothetical protein AURDEDRAFT_67176, partial [Auricularia subglabra TFB-10046 SS5]